MNNNKGEKVALSAYVCLRNRGSEHEIGWKNVKDYSAKAEKLYLFTSKFENNGIGEQLDELPNVEVFLIDIPKILNDALKSIPFVGYHIAAYLWEFSLFFYLNTRYKKKHFDLGVKSSYGSYRWPTFLWCFAKELHINPISGGGRFPIRFLAFFSFRAKVLELFRMFVQLIPFIDPFAMLSMSKATKIFAANHATRKILPKKFQKKCIIKEDFLEVFPEDFRMAEAKVASSPDRHVLKLFYTGRVLEWKGVMLVLRALKKVNTLIPYELTIMGNGPAKAKLARYAAENNLKVNFVSPQNVPRKDLSFYFYSNDIFVFPSLHAEGGFAPVEAKLHDMALLTLDFSGLDLYLNEKDLVINTEGKSAKNVIETISEKLLDYFTRHKSPILVQ